jgi:hypothetical protein
VYYIVFEAVLEFPWENFLSLCSDSWIGFSFFFVVLEFELRAYTLSRSTSLVFVMGFFKIGSFELFAWGWLQTMTLLISAS